MHPDLITFGETMVLFDPVDQGPLRHVHHFKKRFAGAESNVAIGVSRLGHKTGWISQVSDDELGDYIVNAVRGEGVDTSKVYKTTEAPSGIYIKEKVRAENMQVYYYRHHSAASKMKKNQIDWEYVKKAKIIHFTGITPFLSKSCYEVTKSILDFAKKNNIFTSFDPNLRMKLISDIPNHKEILLELAKGVDLFMPGLAEADYLFDTKEPEEIVNTCRKMDINQILLKDGADGTYYATNEETGFVKSKQVKAVVDTVGAGDGFAAGVLSALLEGKSLREAVERGSIIGALVVSTAGDIEGLPTQRQLTEFINTSDDVTR